MFSTTKEEQDKQGQESQQELKKEGKGKGFRSNKKKLIQGDVSDLGHNVYLYGTKNQGNVYLKTTEAIAEYVGREYNKAMRVLVKNLKESTPVEPKQPSGKVSDVEMKKYEKELSRYYTKYNEYVEYKAKVFVIIKGQCTLTMKNKVESLKDYEKIEEDDDVIRLLKGLKQLAFTTVDVQYKYWTVCWSMNQVFKMKQMNEESLVAYYKRFVGMVEVAESQWGDIVPTKIGDDKNTRDKFLACVFIAGVNQKKFGKLINELNNAYLSGSNNYPKSVVGAVTMLSHYAGDWKPGVTNKEQGEQVYSFAQKKKDVKCFKCGKKGHYANECDESETDEKEKNDNDAVSRRRSSHNMVSWSGG